MLLACEEAEPVGPGAHEAVVEEAIAMVFVGAGGEGRQVDGAEQLGQGAEGALERQLDCVGTHCPRGAYPITQQVAELADG